ncbi:hypothetical protein B0H67DRAFT_638739 [Lasiosphaeris hirsuta]|uniref:Uncharacterized protein n=1 Tax=Lasiosphaeris hirsuta TaxID=260670 RepID=A0AA40BA23_9PEZI|nr:hypothetical protein B0H67DRAFT_638739 [Lasiosphaeris hirsuta]
MKKPVDFQPEAMVENPIFSHLMKTEQHVTGNKTLNRAIMTVSNCVAGRRQTYYSNRYDPERRGNPPATKGAHVPKTLTGMWGLSPKDECLTEVKSVKTEETKTAVILEPDGYKNVRSCSSAGIRHQATGPVAAIVTFIRKLLGVSYNFRVHELTLPPKSSQAQEALLHYLGSQGFHAGVEEVPEKELVIVIYNGHSTRGLTSNTCYLYGNKGGILPLEWIERRLVFAPYDSLMTMNCYYAPSVTRSFQRGTNMVASALGPECSLRRQMLGPREGSTRTRTHRQLENRTQHRRAGMGPSEWHTLFLETVLSTSEKGLAENKKVSVKDLYSELLQAHQVHGFNQREHVTKLGPCCDFITSIMQAEPVSIGVNRVQDDEDDTDLDD